MPDDLLRIQITGDASSASGAIREVSAEAKGLDSELKTIGVSGETAGEQVAEGMEKANYSITEARHAAHLFGEEVGVKVPRALQSVLANSETLGPILAEAFSVIALIAFIELAERAGEKLGEFISTNFIFTDSMKAADASAASMNTEMLKQIDNYDAAEKALARFGKTRHELAEMDIADFIAKQNAEITANAQKQVASLQEAAEKAHPLWKEILGYVSLGTAGTTTESLKDDAKKLTQDIANIQSEAARQMSEVQKAAGAQQTLENEKEAKEISDFWKKNDAQIAADNWSQLQKRLADAGAEAEAEMQLQDKLVENWLTDVQKMSGDQPKLDITSLIAGGVSTFTKDLQAGAEAAQEYGIRLQSDVLGELNAAKKAYDAIVQSGIPVGNQLDDLKKKIQALQKEYDTWGSTAKADTMTIAEAQSNLDGRLNAVFNTQTLMTKGWGKFGQEALMNLDEVGAALIKHLAISLLTDNMEKISHAKTAAAGAYAAMSPIPFVGPVLGAAAAASVFAGAMAFDQGGIVPEDGGNSDSFTALVRPREMILPAPVSDVVQDMAAKASSGSGGGDVHIHAMDSHSFEQFLKRNPSALAAGMNHAYSRGAASIRHQARGK